eukprot:4119792-Pyramimonas_sp.AAC.1
MGVRSLGNRGGSIVSGNNNSATVRTVLHLILHRFSGWSEAAVEAVPAFLVFGVPLHAVVRHTFERLARGGYLHSSSRWHKSL